MKWKRTLITYAALVAVAAVVVLMVISFASGQEAGGEAARLMHASDGCFTVAVLYIGCSVLVFIQEAGNFYGIQFLFHTMVRQFSPRKRSSDDRKSYFIYCQEKKERMAVEGRSPVKSAMLLVGLVCLLLAVAFAALFYRQR
ncbi:MAG: DUF3899 domain-containing protein [Aristaeellaceae bacterium]